MSLSPLADLAFLRPPTAGRMTMLGMKSTVVNIRLGCVTTRKTGWSSGTIRNTDRACFAEIFSPVDVSTTTCAAAFHERDRYNLGIALLALRGHSL